MSDHHNVNTTLNANKTDRTWDQWYLMGYGVMLGEKPKYRVHGEAFYDVNQVMKLSRMYGEFEPKPVSETLPTGSPDGDLSYLAKE